MKKQLILGVVLALWSCKHPDAEIFQNEAQQSPTVLEPVHGVQLPEVPPQKQSMESIPAAEPTPTPDSEYTILEMEKESGVRYVWVEVNGIRLRFIFDTGASNICISQAEAIVLYRQGTLKEEDFIGTQAMQDATGGISEGMMINLKTVKIGNRVLHNITALVIDNNEAPLLLGQSVLEQFGSIEIDNKNNRIKLKN
ncbi:retropepsin-like aspartic protease family protein [Riemerella columbina]|uniref:retropepsin-like aspartic protease family protein n=1 Tax=Riemerella columbina TaxID=103810 RepID=UPI00266FD8B7|nr:retropepsin-like aspartic protease [Riemerella columbina]WKS94745.1 retroviral-like aspartic protease family protein [Riemerella columbina]